LLLLSCPFKLLREKGAWISPRNSWNRTQCPRGTQTFTVKFLYQELLTLAVSASAEIMALGGDLLPSFPPTKRYEDMIPNQKAFIDQFLAPSAFTGAVRLLFRSHRRNHLRVGQSLREADKPLPCSMPSPSSWKTRKTLIHTCFS
jgi:hypothetical protein